MKPPTHSPVGWLPHVRKLYSKETPFRLLFRIKKAADRVNDLSFHSAEYPAKLAMQLRVRTKEREEKIRILRERAEDLELKAAEIALTREAETSRQWAAYHRALMCKHKLRQQVQLAGAQVMRKRVIAARVAAANEKEAQRDRARAGAAEPEEPPTPPGVPFIPPTPVRPVRE